MPEDFRRPDNACETRSALQSRKPPCTPLHGAHYSPFLGRQLWKPVAGSRLFCSVFSRKQPRGILWPHTWQLHLSNREDLNPKNISTEPEENNTPACPPQNHQSSRRPAEEQPLPPGSLCFPFKPGADRKSILLLWETGDEFSAVVLPARQKIERNNRNLFLEQ